MPFVSAFLCFDVGKGRKALGEFLGSLDEQT